MSPRSSRRQRATAPALISALATALAPACGGSGEGRPDESLGPLVVPEEKVEEPIDVDKAASHVTELKRALSLPHARVGELLGSHRAIGKSTISVREGEEVVEDLADEVQVLFDSEGNFHATLDNSKEYGRHAFFVADQLYLRPRYGKFHQRDPADDSEPARIRNEIFGGVAAYFDLLSAGVEVTDRGATNASGRPARQIEIKLAPEPGKPAPQRLDQRSWRKDITVLEAGGTVALDVETGVPLSAAISGTVRFVREGRTFNMSISAEHQLEEIGTAPAVTPPPAEEVVEISDRSSEFDEQAQLLRGIAPPPRKAATPQDPGGPSESPPASE